MPQERPGAHAEPQGQVKLWEDNDTNTKVANADQGSDGGPLDENDFIGVGKEAAKQGLYALKKADLFNLLCIPPYINDNQDIDLSLIDDAAEFCEQHRAFFIIDPPSDWTDKDKAKTQINNLGFTKQLCCSLLSQTQAAKPFAKKTR